ncbi:MAG: hypothetical protein ACREO7_10135 [Pseudoxanthomonas sp.]
MPLLSVLLAATALSSSATGLPSGNEGEDIYLGKLATCQESWFDWKNDDRRMGQYIDRLNANYTRIEEEPAFLPKVPGKVLGFPLVKVYPQSVGMGVGFSLQLDAPFAKIRDEVEGRLGKPLECSTSDGMTSCGVELGENKTVMLTAFGDGADAVNLLGCYYYYEK